MPSDDPSLPSKPPQQGPMLTKAKLIRNELAMAILTGRFRPLGRIPTVRELRRDFGTGGKLASTLVVQQAMTELQAAGFVAPSRAGQRYRVAEAPPTSAPEDWGLPPIEPPGADI